MTPVQWELWLAWIEDPRDLTYRQWAEVLKPWWPEQLAM